MPSINPLGGIDIWALSEQMDDVPSEFKFVTVEPKGHKGMCLDREDELNDIEKYFGRQWEKDGKGELDDNDCIAYLITNAPGAGKTTLREEASVKLMEQGIIPIEINTFALETDEQLVEMILEQAAGQKKRRKRAKNQKKKEEKGKSKPRQLLTRIVESPELASGTAAGLDVVFTGGVSSAALAGYRLLRKGYEILRQRIAEEQPKTVTEALQALDDAYEGKWIITVDECHTWSDPKVDRKTLRRNIGYLTNPSFRDSIDIGGGGLLLSGLGNAASDLDGLGLSRAQVSWLGPLTVESGIQVIRKEIREAEIPEAYRDRVIEQWVTQLNSTFTQWPQHSAAAGMVAAKILRVATAKGFDQDPVKDEMLLQYATWCTASIVQRLYDARFRRAQQLSSARAPEYIVALANVTNNRMSEDVVRMTVAEAGKAAKKLLTGKEESDHIDGLLRAGLLRPTKPNKGETQTLRDVDSYSMGIPSLQTYITQGVPADEMAQHEEMARRLLAESKDPHGTAAKMDALIYGQTEEQKQGIPPPNEE